MTTFNRIATIIKVCMWALSLGFVMNGAQAQESVWPAKTYYRYQEVAGKNIFYREAGDPSPSRMVTNTTRAGFLASPGSPAENVSSWL